MYLVERIVRFVQYEICDIFNYQHDVVRAIAQCSVNALRDVLHPEDVCMKCHFSVQVMFITGKFNAVLGNGTKSEFYQGNVSY